MMLQAHGENVRIDYINTEHLVKGLKQSKKSKNNLKPVEITYAILKARYKNFPPNMGSIDEAFYALPHEEKDNPRTYMTSAHYNYMLDTFYKIRGSIIEGEILE